MVVLLLSFIFISCPDPEDPQNGTPEPTGIQKTPVPGTGTPLPGSVFSVSGRVIFNTIGIPEVTMTLTGSSDDYVAVTDDEGNFVFNSIPPGIYTLFPEKTGFTFTPGTYYIDVSQDITDRKFTGGPATGFRIDPWGYAWDETLRASTDWDTAADICESLGGRLPTATELYRNYHSNPTGFGGTISSPDESYYLWTMIPHSAGYYVAIKLNDGSVTYYTKTTELYFRCVWPDKEYDTFRNSYVYGPPGEAGFQVRMNRNLFSMDTFDRPPVTYNSAVQEAAFYHAFIPPESVFTSVIRDGLPNGSNQWIWTSDHTGWNGSGFLVGIVKWQSTDPGFNDTYSTYASHQYLSTSYAARFRCAGVKKVMQPNPKTLENGYTDSNSLLKTTRGDQGALTMFNAIKACFNSGGHLPTHQDYMILIQSGLPNGSGNWLWTSEYENDNYVGIIRWANNIDQDFTGYYSTYMNNGTHTTATAIQYRPVYYPIDMDYNGPAVSSCNGGRFVVTKTLGNGYAVYIWSDMYDRDAATYQDAIDVCRNAGGHLASRRDLVELIVNGLPNGSGNWIWTSDRAYRSEQEIIRWTGTYDPETSTYADQWSTDASDQTQDGTAELPYRCVWTNEVRIR